MSKLSRRLFRWLVAASVVIAGISFLVDVLGLTHVGALQGSRLKLIIIAGVLLLLGIGARFFGERVLRILGLSASSEALIHTTKADMAALRFWIQKRKSDAVIAILLFGAAVLEVSVYVPMFLSNGVRGGLVSAGSSDPLVVSSTGFSHVPLAWYSNQISNLLSSFAPFISPYGFLFGIVVILLYGIFRLGMGRVVALLCTLSFMLSSLQLDHLIPFWDKYFVRAPFVFCLVLIMGILVTKSFKPRGTVGLAIVAGIVMGQGLMFRPDLTIFAVSITLTLLFFIPRSEDVTLKVKFLAVLFFAVSTLFSFSTCLTCVMDRAANGHAFINSSTPFFNDRLGLISPKLDWNYLFLDEFTSSMSFAQARVFDENISYAGYGPVDDQAKRIILNFPADALARFYGAASRVMEIPFTYSLHPVGVQDKTILSLYAGRGTLLNSLSGSGIWLWAAALLMISFQSLRKGIFCLLLIPFLVLIAFVHLVGYYFFYLEFMTYWALGFVAHHSVSGVVRFSKLEKKKEQLRIILFPFSRWNGQAKRMMVFAVGTVLIIWLPLFLLRQYQISQVSKLVHQYDTAAIAPIEMQTVPARNGNVLLTSSQLFKPTAEKKFQVEEFLVAFDGSKCDSKTVWFTLRYTGESHRRMDFSRSMSIDLSSPEGFKKRLFFPAFAQKDGIGPDYTSSFSGIEISVDQAACLGGLFKVRDLRQLDMLLTLQLPFNHNERSYARLPDVGRNHHYTVPEKMPAETVANILSQPLTPITAVDADYQDPIFSFADDKSKASSYWKVHGHAKDNSHINLLFPINGPNWKLGKISYVNADALLVDTDLMITKPKWHRKGSAFVARGTLYGGGVAFTLLNEDRPSGFVVVTNPGVFDVIIEAPKDGFYSVGLMNYIAYYNTMENRMIAKAGWAE
ncbi:hypothetical protein D4S03_00690 [bacterium]|nr:MAG: hypothetical protein D4S03_00690 [bacterium]